MSQRRNYKYSSNQQKRKHQYKLEPGLSGFLCTCNGKLREKECIRESYNLLNQFADVVFGPEGESKKEDSKKEESSSSEKKFDDDIADSLAQEVKSMKADLNKKVEFRRFQAVDSGANGTVFIRSTVPDPVKLAHTILSSIENSSQKSKFLLRLLPIEVTCKANLEEISNKCDKLFDKYFSGDKKTFAIVYNHHNNDNVNRDELIHAIADLVSKKNEEHKVDLKQPELAVLIEIIRGVCCISVMPDYYMLKKYNLLELSLKTKANQEKPVNEGEEKKDMDELKGKEKEKSSEAEVASEKNEETEK